MEKKKALTLVMKVREVIRKLDKHEFTLVSIATRKDKHYRNKHSAVLREMAKRGEIELIRVETTDTGGRINVYRAKELLPEGFRPERKPPTKYDRKVEITAEREVDKRMDNWKSIIPEFFKLNIAGKKSKPRVYKGA